jgi:hypothetical protein
LPSPGFRLSALRFRRDPFSQEELFTPTLPYFHTSILLLSKYAITEKGKCRATTEHLHYLFWFFFTANSSFSNKVFLHPPYQVAVGLLFFCCKQRQHSNNAATQQEFNKNPVGFPWLFHSQKNHPGLKKNIADALWLLCISPFSYPHICGVNSEFPVLERFGQAANKNILSHVGPEAMHKRTVYHNPII